MMPVPPQRSCNLLLEGGITSGIVYPALITTLAETYRFRHVGGTSAGAIGAAFTAAAEYARSGTIPYDGMAVIDRLAADLGKPISQTPGAPLLLQALFQPTDQTRGTFELLSATLASDRLTRLPLKALAQQPLAGLLGALPGLGVVGLTQAAGRPPVQAGGLALGGVLAVVGAVTATLAGGVLRGRQALEASRYGVCPGHMPPDYSPPALTDWLSQAINEVAGLPRDGAPLTFADLEGRGVTLRTITTCLTLGRPYSLPFANNLFYFKKDEMRALFPDAVVRHLVNHGRQPANLDEKKLYASLAQREIYPLPEGKNLPVVVAVRLSLSFPILISAVQLHAVDYSRPMPPGGYDATPVLFTDGGLSSNLPLHFFDSALPEYPTFAVNLRSFPEGQVPDPDEAKNVWLPERSVQGRLPEFRPVKDLSGFGEGILDTSRNWKDGIYITAPGYRDRIVHVHLDGRVEGGLNLSMDNTVVQRLVKRGQAAAQALIDKFSSPDAWNRHRRVRLVNLLCAVADVGREYEAAFASPEGTMSWDAVLAGEDLGYSFADSEAAQFNDISTKLREIGQIDATMDNRPKPYQQLRLILEP
ncbi:MULTISPECIES: patatin-like phospholipase family protein [Deinococcus]|uniref:PNPLA domain-containing protein n=1 Tax=Deinococcus rufus TaxID=2136097 RepID=A0ABV7Z6Z5_9DEIO|nr:patatin-like phospholipase family protein [Deinococcus sp. AB2017081]WQE97147.1 patatin-like phospholipase family protein [Deinococcus sp. AB2017081]